MNEFINAIEQKILNVKSQVAIDEALALYQVESSQKLFDAADRIRKSCCSVKSSICSIINAKTGSCGEDCRYCAQSAHWKTSCIPSPMVTPQKASELSQRALDGSVTRISLVTAGRALTGKDFETGLECFKQMNRDCEGKMALCASFGIISAHQMEQLKAAGVTRYHHNLESGKNYYSHICTTHTYEDRVATVKAAKKAGLEICSGGIIGLGESREDRVDLALAIRDLDVQSVPINILTPIPGTPFENNKTAHQRRNTPYLRSVPFHHAVPDHTLCRRKKVARQKRRRRVPLRCKCAHFRRLPHYPRLDERRRHRDAGETWI